MIEYRTFRNYDPPHLLRLWSTAGLGRGAANGISVDAFDHVNFAQPYFDPQGIIVAVDGDTPVGFAHAGFGCNEDCSDLSRNQGVICAVVVDPSYRLQGIGCELLSRAESFLLQQGAGVISAGGAAPHDPFYFGLYGGSQPSGFLQSDLNAEPFFKKCGYSPGESYTVFQRDVTNARDPVDFQLNLIRRKTKLEITDQPDQPNWWWYTRIARLDSLRFSLVPKSGGDSFASVNVVGLDFFLPSWNARAIGLTDLVVNEDVRKKKYGLALLVEVMRRLRNEMVSCIDAHVASSNEAGLKLFQSAGFVEVDTGSVYRKLPETIDI
ncbi:MAG: hypothetical protein CMJ78_26750 [Planctomycetaceae bacterium]|nr:hypothetical protein [Planctomycetaceae bacterium]